MTKKVKIEGIPDAKKFIVQKGERLGMEFKQELLARMREVSRELQNEMNAEMAGGPINFTRYASFVSYTMRDTGIDITIGIKDDQAAYLDPVINKQRRFSKWIPTSDARLSKQGNIAGLRTNLKNNKFQVVEHKGVKRLIDNRKKINRVVAVQKPKTRKIIYDWYGEAYPKINIVLNKIQGEFSIGR
ncbi:hypothetical protein VC636_25585 [Citrobacter freundii]|uniref:hypothetical protein n=1 Tax=Citrobacter freundii TaxID=546 RepID=UPI00292B41CC|nr:hypothetical protein [Citrobacter freundii]MDV0678303.1 hypothetical protein [Citrobacter freundii]MDV0860795.1 hypothetical protein [Citrobacter freundii]MEB0577836.1 hypothetical protein [Citrobacter freundii]MEB0714282.1 hypothetical protein [Citrobacter freundii]